MYPHPEFRGYPIRPSFCDRRLRAEKLSSRCVLAVFDLLPPGNR